MVVMEHSHIHKMLRYIQIHRNTRSIFFYSWYETEKKISKSARTEYRALTQRLRGTVKGFALNELSAWLNTSQI